MKWYPRVELLKRHELITILLSGRPGGATLAGKAMEWKDIKDVVPLSAELKALIVETVQAQADRNETRDRCMEVIIKR